VVRRVGKKLHMGDPWSSYGGQLLEPLVGGVAGGLTSGAVGVVAYNFEKIIHYHKTEVQDVDKQKG